MGFVRLDGLRCLYSFHVAVAGNPRQTIDAMDRRGTVVRKLVSVHWPIDLLKRDHPDASIPPKRQRSMYDGKWGVWKTPEWAAPVGGCGEMWDYVDVAAEKKTLLKDSPCRAMALPAN